MPERLTPVDILNLRFRRSPAGYSIAEVDEFIRRVAADMEALVTEIAQQRERLLTQERDLAQYRSLEVTLRDALILAQKTAEETRAAARQQAEAELQEARTRAHEIDVQARLRLDEINFQVERLRQESRRLARELRAQLTTQLAWLTEEFGSDAATPLEDPMTHNGHSGNPSIDNLSQSPDSAPPAQIAGGETA